MKIKKGSIIQHKKTWIIYEIINDKYISETGYGNNKYVSAKVLHGGYINYRKEGEIINIPKEYIDEKIYKLIKY